MYYIVSGHVFQHGRFLFKFIAVKTRRPSLLLWIFCTNSNRTVYPVILILCHEDILSFLVKIKSRKAQLNLISGFLEIFTMFSYTHAIQYFLFTDDYEKSLHCTYTRKKSLNKQQYQIINLRII